MYDQCLKGVNKTGLASFYIIEIPTFVQQLESTTIQNQTMGKLHVRIHDLVIKNIE